MGYLISGFYLLFTTLGIVFMKLGGDSLKLSLNKGITFKIGFVTLIGFIFYIVSFLLWQKIIVSNNVSVVVPILTGIVQILTFIAALLIFKETISVCKILGIIFIVVGIILMSIKGVH